MPTDYTSEWREQLTAIRAKMRAAALATQRARQDVAELLNAAKPPVASPNTTPDQARIEASKLAELARLAREAADRAAAAALAYKSLVRTQTTTTGPGPTAPYKVIKDGYQELRRIAAIPADRQLVADIGAIAADYTGKAAVAGNATDADTDAKILEAYARAGDILARGVPQPAAAAAAGGPPAGGPPTINFGKSPGRYAPAFEAIKRSSEQLTDAQQKRYKQPLDRSKKGP